jgi:site-specific recombinase XerD
MHAASTLRARAILEIFYATGCRLTEVAQLRVCDVDFRHGEIRVLGKGNRERVALFGEYAAKALRAYLDGRKTGALFLGHHGKAVGARKLYSIIKQVSRRAGLSHVYPHLLRHSFATHLLSRGINLRYVQELLGHRSIQSTQIYTHVAMDDLRAIHERCHPHGRENTCDVKDKS